MQLGQPGIRPVPSSGRGAHPGALLALTAVDMMVRLAEDRLQLVSRYRLLPHQHPVLVLPHLRGAPWAPPSVARTKRRVRIKRFVARYDFQSQVGIAFPAHKQGSAVTLVASPSADWHAWLQLLSWLSHRGRGRKGQNGHPGVTRDSCVLMGGDL